MENYICKDQDGNLLLSVEQMSEAELSKDPLFTHCLAVVKVGNEYLLGRNKWRNRYEIFGGCAEKEETARECFLSIPSPASSSTRVRSSASPASFDTGFALWADSYDDQSDADRAAHKAVPIQVGLVLAGSIESIVITVNVTV